MTQQPREPLNPHSNGSDHCRCSESAQLQSHERCRCSWAVALQSLAQCASSLNTAQTAINAAQTALQRVTPIPIRTLAQVEQPEPARPSVTVPSSPDATFSMPSDLEDWTSSSRPPSPASRPPSPAASSEGRWYVVLIGREPGVFNGSAGLAENVSGISGGNPSRYSTEALARAAYQQALVGGRVQKITKRP
ncbi:hypothetical protein FPV67DRAFT_1682224 [Lyophyllum atratum]|nr:hypothetical protein FPV67DRAFT_1682224 [Lyophyllum atratum]